MAAPASVAERLAATAALVADRGYALPADRLARLCLGGPPAEADLTTPDSLVQVEGLLVPAGRCLDAARVAQRGRRHQVEAAAARAAAVRFVDRWVAPLPFVRAVCIAGSLASGGYQASDDVDLNLIVDDGCRHLAYVAVNAAGFLHALRHRGKPVDRHTRRPLAPRWMTVNLVLQVSDCFPLVRQDAQMAYELLISQPVHGAAFMSRVIAANPALLDHFPQLGARIGLDSTEPEARRLPAWLVPRRLDGAARLAGLTAWRWMQWTRRGDPLALEHVAFIRRTMRPYALFDEC